MPESTAAVRHKIVEEAAVERKDRESDGPRKAGSCSSLLSTIFLSLGVYTCFLSQGVVQESIYAKRADGTKFRYPIFLVSLVCAFSALVGYCLITALGNTQVLPAIKVMGGSVTKKNVNPNCYQKSSRLLSEGFMISLSYVGAMICTNYSLTKVNYPTQVLVKSAKAVPVIVGGVLIYKRRYPLSDYLAVAMVTGSLILFQVSSLKSTSASNSLVGFAVLCCSLLLDGITGPRQDKLVAEYKLSTGDLMLLLNMFSAPVGMTASIMLEGGLKPWLYVLDHGAFLIPRVMAFIACGSLGQIFIVSLLRNVGSLRLTLITTSRKFFAILLSVMWFRHPLTAVQWLAVVIIMSSGLMKFFVK